MKKRQYFYNRDSFVLIYFIYEHFKLDVCTFLQDTLYSRVVDFGPGTCSFTKTVFNHARFRVSFQSNWSFE